MKRYTISENYVYDRKKVICQFKSANAKVVNELVNLANRGHQDAVSRDAFWREQKKVHAAGGHIGGLSDW